MPLSSLILGRKYRNIARIQHISLVFLGKGFGHLITQMGLRGVLPFRRRFSSLPPPEPDTVPVRLRQAFEELGPTFIKLGQLLSGRPDLISTAYAEEFKKLQDDVPPFEFEAAKKIIEQDLGAPLEELFAGFDRTPVAAASIAQVHNAVLMDGSKVVVKVRRPSIERDIEQDISILSGVAALLEKHVPESRVFNPTAIVDEFARTVRREMDFNIEADNARKFAGMFKDSETITIPAIHGTYTSRRVLTMERIEGIRIDHIQELDRAGFDRAALAYSGAQAFFKQVLEHGFFHADPHPGNMFVMADGRIGVVDFGIVGRLTEENTEVIADTFLALVNQDFDRLVRQYINMGFVTERVDLEKFKRDFKSDLVDLIEPLYGKTIAQVDLGAYLDRITRVAVRHGLKFPRELILMDKALLIMEGLARELDPEFDIMAAARPYAAKLITGKHSARRYAKKARRKAEDIVEFLDSLPGQVRMVLRKIINDEAKMTHEVVHLERFIKDFDRSTNRLSFALIIAGITISSAVIIHSGRGRVMFGYPSLGLIGFILAAVLGLWLVWGIIRSGRL